MIKETLDFTSTVSHPPLNADGHNLSVARNLVCTSRARLGIVGVGFKNELCVANTARVKERSMA